MNQIINHNLKRSIILIFLIMLSWPVFPQQTPDEKSSLNEIYREMYNDAETYNEYKVFKATKINDFWRQAQDSLNTYKLEIASQGNEIAGLKNQINELEAQLEEVHNALTKSRRVSGSISVLGILIPKPVYNIIVWGIIVGLIVAIVIGYGYVKNNRKKYSKMKKEHNTLINDFDNFKKRSLEKKVKLARELQTERNKVMELESKLGPSEERYSRN